jgi:hypothetical protein
MPASDGSLSLSVVAVTPLNPRIGRQSLGLGRGGPIWLAVEPVGSRGDRMARSGCLLYSGS